MRTVSIVIATSLGREAQARRARDAYQRETPGDPQIILAVGATVAEAWRDAIRDVAGDVVHFASDELEPHPGWIEAAKAAIDTRRVAAPTLWGYDGTPPPATRDWGAAAGSEFPTLSRRQLREYGIAPLSFDCGAEFVARNEYAFTLWRD